MSKLFILRIGTGVLSYIPIHYYDSEGNCLCNNGITVIPDNLEEVKDSDNAVHCAQCLNIKKLRDQKQVIDLHRAIRIVSKSNKYPFEIPKDVVYIAMDEDGCWVGFLNKPELVTEVQNIGAFWVDYKSDKYYHFGKYPDFKKNLTVGQSLKKIKR